METVQSRLDCVVSTGHPSIYGCSNTKIQSSDLYNCYQIIFKPALRRAPHLFNNVFLLNNFYFLIQIKKKVPLFSD